MLLGLAVTVLLVASAAAFTKATPRAAAAAGGHLLGRRSVSAAQNSSLQQHQQQLTATDKQHAEDVCVSKGCVEAAHTLMRNMDGSVDPCDDFYQFACGSFVKNTFIPNEKTSITQFSLVSDALKIKMRDLVEAQLTKEDSVATSLVKNLYQSCMQKERIEARGMEPLRDVLGKMKGWPVVEGNNWDETQFHWTVAVYRNRALGYSTDHIFDFSVITDIKNNTYHILDFDQPSLGLPRKYLIKGFNDPYIQAYYNYMVDMAVMLGAKRERALSELKDSLLFEIHLANISLPEEKRRNGTLLYNRMTLADMSRLADDISWLTYVNSLLRATGLQVTAEEPVLVDAPSYVTKAAALLRTTPKRVQANYLLWRVVDESVGMLTDEVRDLQLKFTARLNGQTQHDPRWKECLESTIGSLGKAASALYVRHHPDSSARKAALQMVKHIHQELNIMLGEVDWMDGKTKERAKEKSKAMNYHVAYPMEILNETALTKVYDGLAINATHYFENKINLGLFNTNDAFKRLHERCKRKDWPAHIPAIVVNAFYSVVQNSIILPVTILRHIFFDYDRPNSMNYGAMGFIVGHEMTHGFDSRGRQFDKNGDLQDWWEPATNNRFLASAQCIIEQYGNYTVPEVNMQLDGVLTQNENIADNGAIRLAYRAYQRHYAAAGGHVKDTTPIPRTKATTDDPKEISNQQATAGQVDLTGTSHDRELRLPGLAMNPRQLFWLSAANVWCATRRQENLRDKVFNGYHTPSRYRVNGAFSNMPEFAADFSCTLKTNMNPDKRCRVW